ncbi:MULTISPECIES: hypothetical protein [Rhodococcus]|uniref:lipopolysaccharide biosynthesis protein n=1 Tax=Nocardiaceae TaxID=85025 RepID=UPI000A6EEBA2|nr:MULTISPECIES: hypothetical protein [Rhodococcus]NIL75774.1 hypothetical protein [Rhodococcus sp. B10]
MALENNNLRRFTHRLAQPTLLAQLLNVLFALGQILILTRVLDVSDYAKYGVLTAIWAIGNAVIGTSIGTRVARSAVLSGAKIQLTQRDVLTILLASLASTLYSVLAWQSVAVGVIAALTMASFVLAEARASLELGRRKYSSYLLVVALKSSFPVFALLGMSILAPSVSLSWAMVCIMVGNLFGAVGLGTSVWISKPMRETDYFTEWIGILNFGLWIVSGAGRIVMDGRVPAPEIAVFTLAYALTDRGFRSIQTAYVARNLANAFEGRFRQSTRNWILLSVSLCVVAVLLIPEVTFLVSGGRYTATWSLAITLCSASAVMFASAPLYLKVIATNRTKLAAFMSLAIAIASVAVNFTVVRVGGSNAVSLVLLCSYVCWIAGLALLCKQRKTTRRVKEQFEDIDQHVEPGA